MDLKELLIGQINRHPWEMSRAKILRRIINRFVGSNPKILDVGCGDGYISSSLFASVVDKKILAVDINLSDDQILKLNNFTSNIQYSKFIKDEEHYDIILLLDVLEHVDDDFDFLLNIVRKHARVGTKFLITVPAFQFLFCRHDVFLGHYRRYTLRQLVELAKVSGLFVHCSGYIFSSLLLPKLLLYKILKRSDCPEGVGNWRRGKAITAFIEVILNIDNAILYYASLIGLKIPGLTGWVLCEKQG